MDPLTLVRQFTIDHTPVNYVDGYYIFGKYRFHESTRTAFRRTHKSGGYYTLRDVIFFLENANLQISEYRAKVNAAGVTAVVVQDSPLLMAYLTGQLEMCEQIDLSVMNSVPMEQPGGTHGAKDGTQLSEETIRAERAKFATYLDQFVRQTNTTITKMSVPPLSSLPPPPDFLDSSEPTLDFSMDSNFIKFDQTQLANSRADEQPATTRAMVLIKPGSVNPTSFRYSFSDTSRLSQDFGFALQSFHDHVLKDLVAAPLAKPSDPSSHSKQSSTHTPPAAAAPGHHSSSSLTSSSHKRPHESQSSSRSEGHHHSSSQHPHKSLKTSSSSSSSHAIPAPNDGMNGVAIIIVPSAVTSALCNLNCMDFLRDGRYVSVEEKRRSGARREPEMRFEHETKSGRKLLLRLVDTGTKLNDREWARVVAVFVQGQEWQFKGWKWSSPVELFHNVLGFHFMLDDREVDPKILSWNCRVLKINSSKRHLDAGAFNEFWIQLEDYIRVSKPWIYGTGGGSGSGSSRDHRSHK